MSEIKEEHIKIWNISIDTYKATIKVAYSSKYTTNEIAAWLIKNKDFPQFSGNGTDGNNDCGDGALTGLVPETRTIYIIFDKDSTLSMLHHECIHATMYLFYLIQTTHIDETDEVFAYLSDTIFSEVYNVLTEEFKIPTRSFHNI